MSLTERVFHPAADDELDVLWPAANAAHLVESREALTWWRERAPWSVLLTDGGEAVMLQRWRAHLDILHIRMAWCAPRHVGQMLADVRQVAEEQDLPRLLSPVLSEALIRPYVDAGLTQTLVLVGYTWTPTSVRGVAAPHGVSLRAGSEADLVALTALEDACFSAFWRHDRDELAQQLSGARVAVAEENGEVVGYTLTTLSRGLGTLARVAVRPDSRGRGIGRSLVSEASWWAAGSDVAAMSLCTQEMNDASRALYQSIGLVEVVGRLLLAADPSVCF